MDSEELKSKCIEDLRAEYKKAIEQRDSIVKAAEVVLTDESRHPDEDFCNKWCALRDAVAPFSKAVREFEPM